MFDICAPDSGALASAAVLAACRQATGNTLPVTSASFPLFTTSGSADLKAESARTLTVGAVVTPLRRFSISLDYWNIDIRDAIGRFGGGAQFTLFGCIAGGGDPASGLCQAIRRNADGEILEVTTPSANLARLKARGIDGQLAYALRMMGGDLSVNLAGSYLLGSDYQPNPDLNPVSCAGTFTRPCGTTILGTATPRWKVFNRLNWNSDPLTLSLRHRFFSSTGDGRLRVSRLLGLPEQLLAERGRRLESRHYFDAAASLAIARRFQLTLGVNNLTDVGPALTGSGQVQANTEPSLYDVLGRRFFVSLSARLFGK